MTAVTVSITFRTPISDGQSIDDCQHGKARKCATPAPTMRELSDIGGPGETTG